MTERAGRLPSAAPWIGVLALGAALFAFAATHAHRAGPYYDEAFLGQQAKDFFEPERGLQHPASTREVRILGRPFPLRNAVYLGSLKSQLLIPVFALFGPGLVVMRLATLAFCVLALGLTVAWATRVLGPGAALVAAVLLASDPSFYFYGLYEWGPYSVLLLARAAALLLVTVGWQARRPWLVGLGGLCLGLGIYTRVDTVVPVAAAGLAALAFWPGTAREALGPRRGLAAAGLAGLLLGASPMLLTLPDLLAVAGSPSLASRGGLGEKLHLLASLLDGSRFLRVMALGGLFHRAHEAAAPASLFGLAWALAAAGVAVALALRRGGAGARPLGFLLLASALGMAGMLAVPGAVRAHHMLNVMPLWHLLAAGAAAAAWRWAGAARGGPALRVGLAAALVAVVASQLHVLHATREVVLRTGGRGLFSEAIRETADLLESDPGVRGVSLDWGFHEPLLFLTRRARLLEPTWKLRTARGRGIRLRGGRGDVYLLHREPYDVFGFGAPFLAAVERLETRHPGAAQVREHRDGQGGLAYVTVRFDADHRIVHRRGFRIELLGPRAGPAPGSGQAGS